MEYLKEFEFSYDDIDYLKDNIPTLFKNELNKNQGIVKKNINYLKSLGVKNYKEIFSNFYDIFLIDPSDFTNIFSKYDKEDLIEKLEKNITIVEHL